jgi:hypothetical protein
LTGREARFTISTRGRGHLINAYARQGRSAIMKTVAALITAIALSTTSITALSAAETRYSEWSGAQTVASSDQLVERLNRLIDNAEKQRAADPRFLRDLRNALDSYVESQIPLFLDEDFSDGNFTRSPVWTVASGKFAIDRSGGLRSGVRSAATSQSGQKQDTAAAILDTILGASKSQSTAPVGTQRAEIFTPAKITNTFSATMMLESYAAPGRFDMVVYQGTDRSAGYRLSYFPESLPSLELVRFSRKGSSVIDNFEQSLVLEDGNTHAIEWRRATGGAMTVALDGENILTATDNAIKSGFDGFALVNHAGDYIVRSVEVRGAR